MPCESFNYPASVPSRFDYTGVIRAKLRDHRIVATSIIYLNNEIHVTTELELPPDVAQAINTALQFLV